MNRMKMPRPCASAARRGAFQAILAAAALLPAAACSDDPLALSVAEVAGAYQATTFLAFEGGSSTDLLAQGAGVSILLRLDGTTEGTMTIPASVTESGEEEEISMEGTWALGAGRAVSFDLVVETLIKDLLFEVTPGRLRSYPIAHFADFQLVLDRDPQA